MKRFLIITAMTIVKGFLDILVKLYRFLEEKNNGI